MAVSTGSYTVYGGAAAVNVAVQSSNTAAEVATKAPVADVSIAATQLANESGLVSFLTDIGIDGVTVTAGHVYMDGISFTDISTTLLVLITATATLVRAYYDFKDWNDKRRINRLIMQRASAVDDDDDVVDS